MKKLVQVQEIEGQGLEALMGQMVTVFCLNYIYHGKLTGVNATDIILSGAQCVYSTGAFTDKKFTDAQDLAAEWRIRTSCIESYGAFASKN